MNTVFSDRAWEDYLHWQGDPKTLRKVNALIKECQRTPFAGSGKPEALKGDLKGWWSRRISREDRLIYKVSGAGQDQQLLIAQCRFHY